MIYIFINYFIFFFQFSQTTFTKLQFLIEEALLFIKDKRFFNLFISLENSLNCLPLKVNF